MTLLREWACYSWNHWFFPPQEVLDHARTAHELDEGDQPAHCMLVLQQGQRGGTARKALRLAPHHPEWYAACAATAFFTARQYQEAIEIAETAPEAICDTPAYLAASHAYLGRTRKASVYRDTLYRHYDNQLKRGWYDSNISCIDWLLCMSPYSRREDEAHYLESLGKAGIG